MVTACVNGGFVVENLKRKWDYFEGKNMARMSRACEENTTNLQPH
jgi:hypothetical protein